MDWRVLSEIIKLVGKPQLHDIDLKYLELKTYLVDVSLLREHEEIIPEHVEFVKKLILSYRAIKYPILVDARTLTVLDGHHRLYVVKELGLKYIPVFFVDYTKSYVDVTSFRKEYRVTKVLVIRRAISRKKFPPRTSRHVLIGAQVPASLVPLTALKRAYINTLPILHIGNYSKYAINGT